MEKNAKNFAIWAALHSGSCIFFCDEPSFYGGADGFDKKKYLDFCVKYFIKSDTCYDYEPTTNECILKLILLIGIDYDKTEAFESEEVSIFADTFHDPEHEDIVKGTLVLKDGQRINMFARCKIDEEVFNKMQMFNQFFQM